MSLFSIPLLRSNVFLARNGRFLAYVPKNGRPCRTFMSRVKPEEKLQAAAMITIPILTFGLGVWQVQRLSWKRGVISHIQNTIGKDPLRFDLLDPEEDFAEILARQPEYRRIRVRGRFDHSREIYIRPRPLIDRSGQAAGATGAYVITPFILSSSIYPSNVRGTWILVNRGWVDFEHMDPSTRSQGQDASEMEFIGITRNSEKRLSRFVSEAITDDKNLVWAQRNVERMSSVLGTTAFFIDGDRTSTLPGGPVGGQTILSIRNQHMSYIFTWWTLSAATAYIWFRTYIRPRPM